MPKIYRFASHAYDYPFRLQGEWAFRKSLDKLFPWRDYEEAITEDALPAKLILENKHREYGDTVRVEIEKLPVGYMTETGAKNYRKAIKALGLNDDDIGQCLASVRCKKKSTEFSVKLDLDLKKLEIAEILE